MRKHTAVMIAAICLVMTLPAAALGAKPALTDAQYYQKILDRIEQIRSAGGSETAIDKMLEKEFGWTKLATADGIEAMAAASASDVNIYAPTVFYNNVKARYEAVGSWSWRKCPTAPCWSINYGTSGGNVGGPDAFGIYSSIPVNYKTTAFAIYDEDGDGHSYTNPDDFDTTGVAFREQDTVHVFPWGDFTWDHGTLLMAFSLKSCSGLRGTPFIWRSTMVHTWPGAGVLSTSVNPFSAPPSITFSISGGSESYWKGVSPNPTYWYGCGT